GGGERPSPYGAWVGDPEHRMATRWWRAGVVLGVVGMAAGVVHAGGEFIPVPPVPGATATSLSALSASGGIVMGTAVFPGEEQQTRVWRWEIGVGAPVDLGGAAGYSAAVLHG